MINPEYSENIIGILFSGGKGSRLFPINEFYQKVMMPIGIHGTPLLEYVIRHLKFHGIYNFIALIGYRGEMIQRYFGDGSRFGVEIQYCFDNPKLKGTGSALWNAKELIGDKDMLIYYTDILTSLNVTLFIEDFYSKPWALGSLWLDMNWNEGDQVVIYDEDMNVREFNTRINENNNGHDPIYVNTGISLVSNQVFHILSELIEKQPQKTPIEIDLSTDVFSLLSSQRKLSGYCTDEWWLDVGSISRLTSLSPQLLVRHMAHLSSEVRY